MKYLKTFETIEEEIAKSVARAKAKLAKAQAKYMK